MAQEVILAEQTIEGFAYAAGYGAYHLRIIPLPYTLVEGQEYTVVWDGTECVRTSFTYTYSDGSECIAVGNPLVAGGEDNGDTFCIVCDVTNDLLHYFSTETLTEHTVAIYTAGEETEETYAPNDTVILNYSQNPVTYEKVPKVWLTHPSSTEEAPVLIPFSYGEAVDDVPVELDFSAGDQVMVAPDGTLVRSAMISKPEELTPENVRQGAVIAGITGTFLGDTEEATVELNMADGDQVVTPSAEGKVLSKVTILKPETLVPENIAKDVEVAGVLGTHEGGGGSGISKNVDLDFRDCLVVDTPEVMSKILRSADNVGLYVKYVGESGDYTSGQYYKVVDEYGALAYTPSTAVEVTSSTTLSATVECKIGDLIIAAFAIRSDLVSLSDGWTLISTSQDIKEINATATVNQTLSFAYKYAEATTESITVTQTTAARIYLTLVSLSNASGFLDTEYQYVSRENDASLLSPSFDRPQGALILWGITCSVWSSGAWSISNNSKLIQSTSSTAPRLLLAIDTSEDASVTFTSVGTGSTDAYICGALSIQLEPAVLMVEVDAADVPMLEEQIVREYGDVLMSEAIISKPATLLPENIVEGVDIGGVVGTFKGAQIVTGSTAGNGGALTVTHGLGVVPDIIVVYNPATSMNTRKYIIQNAMGVSKAFSVATIGYSGYPQTGSCYYSSSSSSFSRYDRRSTLPIDTTTTTDTAALITQANETTFVLGNTTNITYASNTYRWAAIKVLT